MHLILMLLTFLTMSLSSMAAFELPPETHPSLIFTAEELAQIRERITREPYSAWWGTVQARANTGLGIDFYSITDEMTRAIYAKSLAMAGLVMNQATYQQKASEALRTLNPFGEWGEGHNEGWSAASFALAYDWLSGSGYLMSHASEDSIIRENLAAQCDKMYLNPFMPLMLNNWKIRYYSGLGLIALAIRDHDGGTFSPDAWLRKGVLQTLQGIWHQGKPSDPRGIHGYAEGPYYLHYSEECYIPFFAAVLFNLKQDLFHDPVVEGIHRWHVLTRLPWGETPNFDDASLGGFPGGLLAPFYPEHSKYYQWGGVIQGRVFVSGNMLEEAVALYDDSIEAVPLHLNPNLFLYESGNAILRSSWSDDALYLMVLGEHGPARKNSGSHEHPDESSFMIAGFGEMLALDSGYICWEEHNLVNNAYNHNMILVDGEGPQKYYDLFPYLGGVDAFLSDFSGNPSMPRVTVSTNYQETDVIRKFYFPESSYFVVVDHLISNTPVDRKFELLIHGNGLSSEGSFTLTDDGGEWHTGNVLFTCSVTSQSSLNYREEIYINSFYYGQKLNHSCLVVEATGRDVTFTSVLVPTLISDGIRPEITCDGKFLNVKIGNHEDYFNIENGELK